MTDWTGNGNSIFKTLGASNHTDKKREANDFYATSPEAIDLLLSKIELPTQVLEPACGSGCLSERLAQYGHDVKSYDIDITVLKNALRTSATSSSSAAPFRSPRISASRAPARAFSVMPSLIGAVKISARAS